MRGYLRLVAGEVEVPVIGAANASAVAAGFELLMGCDVVVASSEASFGLPEVKRGLFAGSGVMHVAKRLPLGVALEVALTGEPIDAERAYALGLVNAVAAPDQVLDVALGFADRIAANAPLSLAATKQLVRMAAYGDPESDAAPGRVAAAGVHQRGRPGRGGGVRREARLRSGRVAEVRAAVCHQYGPPEVVQVEEVARPTLEAGQARIRVRAAAVNYPDVLVMADEYQVTVPAPLVPGSEFAGVVEELADGVEGFEVGDRVMGTMIAGAFAEEVAAPVSALTRIPDGVDDRSAAAFGVAHRTAYHVLRSVAALAPGEELIVLGAGGGVGLAAVQLGVVLGATVTAVASSAEKLGVAEVQGATRLVDHRSGDLRQALRQVLA